MPACNNQPHKPAGTGESLLGVAACKIEASANNAATISAEIFSGEDLNATSTAKTAVTAAETAVRIACQLFHLPNVAGKRTDKRYRTKFDSVMYFRPCGRMPAPAAFKIFSTVVSALLGTPLRCGS